MTTIANDKFWLKKYFGEKKSNLKHLTYKELKQKTRNSRKERQVETNNKIPTQKNLNQDHIVDDNSFDNSFQQTNEKLKVMIICV